MNVEMEEVQMKLFSNEPGFGNGDDQMAAAEIVEEAIRHVEETDIDPDNPDAD